MYCYIYCSTLTVEPLPFVAEETSAKTKKTLADPFCELNALCFTVCLKEDARLRSPFCPVLVMPKSDFGIHCPMKHKSVIKK